MINLKSQIICDKFFQSELEICLWSSLEFVAHKQIKFMIIFMHRSGNKVWELRYCGNVDTIMYFVKMSCYHTMPGQCYITIVATYKQLNTTIYDYVCYIFPPTVSSYFLLSAVFSSNCS